MRKIREILRLSAGGLSNRKIVAGLAISAPTMRQTHVAGEKLFVDYAGTTPDMISGLTGDVVAAQLFVAAGPRRLDRLARPCLYVHRRCFGERWSPII